MSSINTLTSPSRPEQERLAFLREEILTTAEPKKMWELLTKKLLEWFPNSPQKAAEIQEETSKEVAEAVDDASLVKEAETFTNEQENMLMYIRAHLEGIPDEYRRLTEEIEGKTLDEDVALTQGEHMLLLLRRTMEIYSHDLTAESMETLLDKGYLKEISMLSFADVDIKEGALEALAHSPDTAGIKRLVFDDTEIPFKGLMALAKSEYAKDITEFIAFGSVKIDRKILEVLAQSPNFKKLETLELSDGDLVGTDIKEIVKPGVFPALKSLSLEANTVRGEDTKLLAKADYAPQLKELSLWGNAIGAIGVEALLKEGKFQSLESLNLSGTGLSGKGIDALCAAEELHTLKVLKIKNNNLGQSGVNKIAENATLQGLEELDAYGCNISDEGAQAIVQSPHFQNLKKLNLGGNAVKPETVMKILKKEHLKNLKELRVNGYFSYDSDQTEELKVQAEENGIVLSFY